MATNTVTALRRKFIIVALAATFSALLIIFAIINLTNHVLATERVDSVITVLHEHDGTFPENWKKQDPRYKKGTFQATSETPFETRYFVASFDGNRDVTSVDASHIAQLDEAEVRATADDILGSKSGSGYYERYRYRIFTEDDGSGMIIVVDCFQQLQSADVLLIISAVVMGATVIVMLLLIVPLSRRFVDPYVRNLERQKRFVTDASHELKTPIAIIAANTDLIEATEGASAWTKSTRAQTARLTKLTGDLIELARTDEPIEPSQRTDVNLAAIVVHEVEDFVPLAEASEKKLICQAATLDGHIAQTGTETGTALPKDRADTEGDASGVRIFVDGSPEELDRLVSVLVENAVKYCDGGGSIHVELTEHKRDVVLVVSNPCASLSAQDTHRLFDRFYRADASRSRSTGGYGIGLSIARGIVARHEGTIRARKLGDDLEIRVVLPRH